MRPDLPFELPILVRFRDMDAMGHVNNSVYFTYLETARQEYWFALCGTRDVASFNFIIMKAECTYKSPATIGETVLVRSGITRIGNSSFTWEYHLSDHASGRVIALGTTEQVCYDYALRRPMRMPTDLRDRIAAFESGLRAARL
ncbi:MAG: acyl-CoA thioesterase [Armatimonadetes bacterium]|nr:acyl-CoA thioesterase [Armatimonadota bacterium]